MTARIDAARTALFNTVKMYAPVHAQFSDEATRQLDKALGEYHNAVVEQVLDSLPPPVAPPIPPPPAPPSFVPPTERQPEAVGDVEHPAPVATPTPPAVVEAVAKAGVPPTPEAAHKPKAKKSKD